LDVRSGMVCVIAALVAEGKSVLHDVEHIERGYEGLVEKLKMLGRISPDTNIRKFIL
jgi:UDP-N-acetylglucosamine 1-carboxyvinyltransferase